MMKARSKYPYYLETPFVISFSGGRTSAYMLKHILDYYGGNLPQDGYAVFCNTGKERPETLDFVQRCSSEWNVPVVWLEYRYDPGRQDAGHTWTQVNYATASRNGEPFDILIARKKMCPNRIARFCTSELKVKTMWRWVKEVFGWERYEKAIGFRADEPGRVQRIGTGETRNSEQIVCPLYEAGVTVAEVNAYWKAAPFDLAIPSTRGNCDLCFLKKKSTIIEIMHERPDLAKWWIDHESGTDLFRSPKDRPRYSLLLAEARQPRLFDCQDEEDDTECACVEGWE